jgi:GT2 family glycosyltransferase
MSHLGLAVPTFNRPFKLKRFLHCLTEQSFRDFTIYLVDSGYNEKTASDLQKYREKIDLRIIPATPKYWWAAATNLAVRSALQDRCELIMTINDDAIIKPDFLEKMVITFEKYKCRMLGARIDFADQPETIWSLGLAAKWCDPDLFGLDYRDSHNIKAQALPQNILNQEIVQTQGQCGDGLLIAASVFYEIGLYHEKICPQCHSDREFSFRAQRKGIKMWCTTKIILYNDVYNDSEAPLIEQCSQQSDIQQMNWLDSLYFGVKKMNWLYSRVKKMNWLKSIYFQMKQMNWLYGQYFQIKSSYYLWPGLYVCLKYAPAGKKLKSIMAYLKQPLRQ